MRQGQKAPESASPIVMIEINLKNTRLFGFNTEDFIAKDTTIVVPDGKVWAISNAKVYMIYDNRISGQNTYLYLNNQIISYSNPQFSQNTDPIWLPSGTYRVNIRTEEKYERKGRFSFNGFLSGIEYSVGYNK